MNQLKKVNNIDTTSTSDLVKKKTDYNTKKKINDHNLDKNITTLEWNQLTAENVTGRCRKCYSKIKTSWNKMFFFRWTTKLFIIYSNLTYLLDE